MPVRLPAAWDLAIIAELLAVPPNGRYPVLEISPQQKREMTLTALLDQLDGIAAQKPVLIVFEDAHWIDPTSLDLLDRTVARVADLPVLLVMTFRPELHPTWVDQVHVTMLPLTPVDRADGAGIIAGVTKGKALPAAVAEQILDRTDGVPLFIRAGCCARRRTATCSTDLCRRSPYRRRCRTRWSPASTGSPRSRMWRRSAPRS